jgi:hypothetical protein
MHDDVTSVANIIAAGVRAKIVLCDLPKFLSVSSRGATASE